MNQSFNREVLKQKLFVWVPYLLLAYLCIWQAFSLLHIEDEPSLQYFALVSGFAFYVLLLQISKKLFNAILIFSFFLSLFIYPVLHVYGSLDKNLLSSLFYTNTGEATSYMKVVPTKVYVNLALLLLLTILLFKFRFKKIRNNYLTGTCILILLAPIVVYLASRDKRSFKDEAQLRPKLSYVYAPVVKIPLLISIEIKQIIATYDYILRESKQSGNWQISNEKQIKLKNTIVVVIGESARKDFWHAYGFPMETSPFTDSSPHLQFDNFISAGTHTVSSLLRTIAYTPVLSKASISTNLVNLCKKVGYKTYWVSNQGYIGIYDSPISIIASCSDQYFKMTGGDYNTVKMDKDMLPVISKIIKTDTAPKVIFVHMIGSHPDIEDRTQGHYDQFVLSKEISCYIQTIKNTDSFLSVIYKDLNNAKKDFGMIYFSDHGLLINKDLTFVHGDGVKEAHEVPLLIWGTNIKSTQHYSAFRNGKNFIELFCELYGIQTTNIQLNHRFLSNTVPDSSVYKVVENGDEVFDFRKLKSNPLPKELQKKI